MERVVIFLDWANLESAFRRHGVEADCQGLRDFLSEGRLCLDSFVYVPVSPYCPAARDRLIRQLSRRLFFVRTKVGRKRRNGKWKADFDVELTIDMLRYAQSGKADIFVVCSGDRDLMAAYCEVRQRGIRVEVASTRRATACDIMAAASGFIDLGAIIEQQKQCRDRSEFNGHADQIGRPTQ